MPPQGDRTASLQATAFVLLLLAAAVWKTSRLMAALEESARIDRARRHELQERLQIREEQLDGALERIKQLMPDDPAAGQ